jgi:hypothetical protein
MALNDRRLYYFHNHHGSVRIFDILAWAAAHPPHYSNDSSPTEPQRDQLSARGICGDGGDQTGRVSGGGLLFQLQEARLLVGSAVVCVQFGATTNDLALFSLAAQ